MSEFNTSVFDPTTLNKITLCNEIKAHFDATISAITFGEAGWDKVEYTYKTINGGEEVIEFEKYEKGSLRATVRYVYNQYYPSSTTKLRLKQIAFTHGAATLSEYEYEYLYTIPDGRLYQKTKRPGNTSPGDYVPY